ncbi:GNAT family N-acetyltransferase [Streptococcus oricebi]|uniref:GNAT family N-acetyltransferase n=1 Tax=Streptococcus oricebi TaxID=1547447 RepID=A0ABS5B299_9STRE|nr:GNAT family N-acetyltransferase [Streptococcus oricebi]MBP2622631.1 GNAT family N-acetyltransferase [Streptococcus oricebi]
MKIVSFTDSHLSFFKDWQKNMVSYGLKAGLGQLLLSETGTSIFYDLGNFLFLAGSVDARFFIEYYQKYGFENKILISEEKAWQNFLDKQQDLRRFERYAFSGKVDMDKTKLTKLVQNLPEKYELQPINQVLYKDLGAEVWSQDLQGDFSDYDQFVACGGFGFALLDQGKIIAAITTGLVYGPAVEIEIATQSDYQKQGLAKILAAQFLLEADLRSVVPLWDAHNDASRKIAQYLGYDCLGAYPAYELIRNE